MSVRRFFICKEDVEMVKDKSVNGMKEKKTLFGNMTYSEYAD